MKFNLTKFKKDHPVKIAMAEILDDALVAQIAKEQGRAVRFVKAQLNYILIENGCFLCTRCGKICSTGERQNGNGMWCKKCTSKYQASVYHRSKKKSDKIVTAKGIIVTEDKIKPKVKCVKTCTNEMKSTLIKLLIGGLFAQVAIRMSSVAHLPFNGWNLVVIVLVTFGSLALVYGICDIYRLHKESKNLMQNCKNWLKSGNSRRINEKYID